KFDIGAMGEFDVAVLIEQYVGKDLSKRMYPEWRGGYYYAATLKANTAAPLGLLYVSRWSNEGKAAELSSIYATSLTRRYKKGQSADSAEGNPATSGGFKLEPLKGRHTWTTEEGAIVIEQQGDTVFISESLDPETTQALEKEVFAK